MQCGCCLIPTDCSWSDFNRLAARFLHRQIKRRDSTKYFALLRELSAACADRDDGDTLTNSLLHVRAILESGGVGIES